MDRPSQARQTERTDSNERPTASGPPRLNLAGSKPSWREREEAKKAQQVTGAGNPSVPPSDIKTDETQLPKRSSGYVPPARRAAEGGLPVRGRQEATNNLSQTEPVPESVSKWRPSQHDGLGRDGSPADGPSPRFLSGFKSQPGGRDASADSSRPVSSDGTTRTDSPAEPLRKPAPGKFVPPHLRNK